MLLFFNLEGDGKVFKGHALKLNSLTLCKSATTNLAPSHMKTGIG